MKSFNWDNIKYLFQIPIDWFVSIGKKVFNAYGTNFIVVKDGDSGGMNIDVDEQLFEQAVKQYIPELSGDYVLSVDGIGPDENGNVQLSGYVDLTTNQTAAGEKTWTNDAVFNGNVYVEKDASGGTYGTQIINRFGSAGVRINGDNGGSYFQMSNTNGNTTFTVNKAGDGTYIEDGGFVSITGDDGGIALNAPANYVTLSNSPNDQAPDNAVATVGWCNGQISGLSDSLSAYVKTVNNVGPDENGNVDINLSGVVRTSDINNAASPNPVASYTYNNIRYTGNLPGGLDWLFNWAGAYNYQTLDDEISDLGYIKDSVLSDYVKTVDGIEPDEYGNVELSGYVKSVDNISADANGNVALSGYVKTIDDEGPDENGNVSLSNVVKSIEETFYPDPDTGDVSFELAPSKWMKTDEDGILGTTDDEPIILSSGATGYVYANNGNVEYKNEQYVDLSTAQTAAGQKTWNDNATFRGDVRIDNQSHGGYIDMSNTTTTDIIMRGDSASTIQMAVTGQQNVFQILKGSLATTLADSSIRIDAPNLLDISSDLVTVKGVNTLVDCATLSVKVAVAALDTATNGAILIKEPDGKVQNAIATVGYVDNKLLSGAVKTVNNIPPDQNGNVNVSVPSISACVLTSDINNASSPHPVASYTYANIKYTGNLPGAMDNLYGWVGAYNYNTLDDEITDLGYVKDSDLGDLAYLDNVVVDGHTSDSNGNVSFNLAASKWVKTDAQGHLTTTNETPVAVDTTQWTPQNAIFNFVKNVTWNGTKLQKVVCSLRFVNGVLVTVGNDVTQDIDTAVTYNP